MSEAAPTIIHPRHKAFSLGRVSAIASNTLLELIRLKVFYFLLIFGLVLIGSSIFMIKFSFQEQFQILKDVSLGAMSMFTWLLAVLATAMLLPKDIEDRTLYTILAKPVPRFEYLLGKLLGVMVLLAIATLVMAGMFVFILYARQEIVIAQSMGEAGQYSKEQIAAMVEEIKKSTFTWSLVPAVVTIYLKAALCAALTLLISTFASSWIFTVVVSVAVYIIGHVQGIARDYWLAENTGTLLTKIFLGLISLLFPDLQLFNLVDDIVAGTVISTPIFLKTVGLGGIYIAVYLFFAYFIFLKKEL